MTTEIHSLSEITNDLETIGFLATILSVNSDGDRTTKKPLRMTLKLEDSGEVFDVVSWSFDKLEEFKSIAFTDEVYKMLGAVSMNEKFGLQVRITAASLTGNHSKVKILSGANVSDIENETNIIVSKYLLKSNLYPIVEKLVLKNQKFWSWPAATGIHHNYQGGLAKHSLGVCKTAIAIAETYNKENISMDVLVAGALLHDIGKIEEYQQDGKRTIYGNLIPHPIAGLEDVILTATSIDKNLLSDTKFIMLKHIILSHHNKLEFGSPVQPGILEAAIIARADESDAMIEAVNTNLNNTNKNEFTANKLPSTGSKIFKWN